MTCPTLVVFFFGKINANVYKNTISCGKRTTFDRYRIYKCSLCKTLLNPASANLSKLRKKQAIVPPKD